MKKILSLLLVCAMLLSAVSFAMADQTTYTGSSQGFGSEVKVTVTLDGRKVVGLEVDALQYSYMENPMDRGVLRSTVHRVAKSQTRLK